LILYTRVHAHIDINIETERPRSGHARRTKLRDPQPVAMIVCIIRHEGGFNMMTDAGNFDEMIQTYLRALERGPKQRILAIRKVVCWQHSHRSVVVVQRKRQIYERVQRIETIP
jgi:hypothetical protein